MEFYSNYTTPPTPPPPAAILEKTGLLYFAAFCVIVFIVVGVLGNLLTIVALVKCPRIRGATAAFIVSLCVADFIFCSINLPFSASRFINHTWIHGAAMCVAFPFLRYVNVGLSLLSITAITLNRYVLIVHPRAYGRIYQPKFIALQIGSIWLFSVSMLLPTLIGVWGRFDYDPKILNCSILEVGGRSPKAFLFLFGFVLPCVTIIFCYARIFWVVRTSQRRVHKHTADGCTPQTVFKSRKKDGISEQKQKREDWRVTRMVLVIFCSFVVCYLPITIVKVTDRHATYPALHIIGYILIFMSACINPIIYGLTNKQYRKAYKTTLTCGNYSRHNTSGAGTTTHDSSFGTRTILSLVAPPAAATISMSMINNSNGDHIAMVNNKL